MDIKPGYIFGEMYARETTMVINAKTLDELTKTYKYKININYSYNNRDIQSEMEGLPKSYFENLCYLITDIFEEE